MHIIKIKPQGFCKGVARALHIINDELENEDLPRPIYMLGGIVHNEHIIKAYQNLGVITISSLDEIKKKGTLVITAHGISRIQKEKINDLGLRVIDTTCSEVSDIHSRILRKKLLGFSVFYFGKSNHPECKAVMEDFPSTILIETIEDAKKVESFLPMKYFCSQSTMSYDELNEVKIILKNKYPDIVFDEDICLATMKRQFSLKEVAKTCDMCIIVGDGRSNNSNNLLRIASQYCKSFMINSVKEVKKLNFKDVNKLGITAGASTPNALVDEIIKSINDENYVSLLKDEDYIK